MTRALLRALTLAALTYACATAAASSIPAWRWLPDVPHPIAHANCVSAGMYMRALGADPSLASEMLPIVMATEFERGPETGHSAASCSLLAEAVRTEQPVLRAIPERYLCRSIRAWARDRYSAEAYRIGPPLWLDGNAVVGAPGVPALLERLELRYDERGGQAAIVRATISE